MLKFIMLLLQYYKFLVKMNITYSFQLCGDDLSELYYIDLQSYSRYLDDAFNYSQQKWYKRFCTKRPHLVSPPYKPVPITDMLPTNPVKGVFQNEYLHLRLVVRNGQIGVSIAPKKGILVRSQISLFDSLQIYTILVTSSFTHVEV